ncbi:MAG TPA: hypothetical protein VGB94_08060 [Acidobacteriaceae bacterium]
MRTISNEENPRSVATLLLGMTASVLVLAGLTGCTMGSPTLSATDAGGSASGAGISGGVQGGNQPISGATIQLYAAGSAAMPSSGGSTGGYGQGAVALIPAGSMTASSTNNYYPGGLPACAIAADGSNPSGCTALPQTDSNGNFVIGSGTTYDYTCPSTASQVYIVATGGNPGLAGTVNNQYIALMAGLGTCPANGTLSSSLFININEISTVATVWALQQFMPTPTGAAASAYLSQGGATAGIGVNVGTPSGPAGGYANSGVQTAVYGQQNAFLMINNLVNLSTGSSGTGQAGSATNSWAQPWAAKINTIADILAYCINSDPTAVNYCSSLMADATPSSAATAADTIQAAWYMARNPMNNVAKLYTYVTSQPPFPGLASAPNDWGIFVGLNPKFASVGGVSAYAVNSPYNGAIDEYGHVWLSNDDSTIAFVSELAGDGSVLGGPFGNPANATLGGALATANSYTASGGYSSSCSTTAAHTLIYSTIGPKGIAIDLTNTVWVDNPDESTCSSAKTMMRVNGGSGYSPSSPGWIAPSMATGYFISGTPYAAIVVDASDNVYTSTSSSSSGGHLVQFLNTSGSYSVGATTNTYKPTAMVVDASTSAVGGPYVWTVGDGNCANGQIYQQPTSTLGTVYSYQNPTPCVGTGNTLTGTFVNINAALSTPFGAALDRNNNIWITNSSSANTVNYFVPNSSGILDTTSATSVTSTTGLGGIVSAYGVAVDGNNYAWIESYPSTGGNVAVLSASTGGTPTIGLAPILNGTSASGLGFAFTAASTPFPRSPHNAAIDPSGNMWFFGNSLTSQYTYVSVLVGEAAPVVTPLALSLASGMIGQKP